MCRCAAAALARAVVAFLDAVLFGFFLSCFGPRPRDPLVRKDRLGELLQSGDYEQGFGGSGGGLREDLAGGCGPCGADEELVIEANYLKLCGTISEIPAELRNLSCQINLENNNECDDMHTNAPAIEGTSTFESNSSEGFRCEKNLTRRPELSTKDTDQLPVVDSVHQSAFPDKSPFQSIKNKKLVCSGSPFPTPLVLRDDMQTPGTIYTPHKGSSMSGKRVRTRKQFVYPMLRPIENRLQHIEVVEDSSPTPPSKPPKRRNLGEDSIMKPQHNRSNSAELKESKCQIGTPKLLDDRKLSKSSSDENVDAFSLSHWLKPSSVDEENQGDAKCLPGNQLYDENSLFTQGHVFAASEVNWDVENPTPRLTKTWECNGIPNTTTKYKEDQKVSWHTTPFEERLLKVLSDEELHPPRKLVRVRFNLEETAEH